MKKTGHHIMIFLIVLYAFHLILKFSQVLMPSWISSYFADSLCMPILLYLTLLLIQRLKRKPVQHLTPSMIIVAWIYVGMVFEWFLPQFSQRYTSDPYDILFYGIGALSFYIFQKQFVIRNQHLANNQEVPSFS